MTRPTVAARVLLRGHLPDDEAQEVFARYLQPPDMDATWQARLDAYDTDRSPRFPPGWWILPGILLGALFWAAAIMVGGAILIDMAVTGADTLRDAGGRR